MKLKYALTGTLALLVTACATAPTVPTKRPLTSAAIAQIGSVDLNTEANQHGIGASWFQTQSNGAGAGLAGAFAAVIVDAVINAAPSSRASKAANEIAEKIVAEDLNSSLLSALNSMKSKGVGALSIKTVSLVNGFDDSLENNGDVVLSVRYVLSEDGSAFRAVANVSYENTDIPYITPYTFEGEIPKDQKGGPLYKNQLVFNSKQFPVPPLTDDLKAQLVLAVKEKYRDENGELPTEGKDFKNMENEINDAKDDNLKKSEISVFLVQKWLEADATPLIQELDVAHRFIAKYVVEDLNSTEIPALNGEDRIIETLNSGRVVKLIGQGVEAGSYVSLPGNLESFTTYGNTLNYSKVGYEAAKKAKLEAK